MPFSCSAPRMELAEFVKEVESCSKQELEEAERDLYGSFEDGGNDTGVPHDDSEHGSTNDAALRNLQVALDLIHDKDEYNRAVEICPDYVKSEEFRIMFLRSEDYDATKAAERMVVYWTEKVKIFGRQIAFQRLTMDDLEEQEVRAIRAGSLLALPTTDAKGRGLIYSDLVHWESEHFVMNRVAFYMAHALLEDETIQQRGVVLVLSFTSALSIQNFKRKVHNRVINTFRKVLPIRIVGVHLIDNTAVFSLIRPQILHSLGPELRRRLRIHQGSEIQVLSSLREYGITATNFPHVAGGSLDVNISAWIEQRHTVEHESLLLRT